MSDEEFEALTQDDHDRKQARKLSAVERHTESVPQNAPSRCVELAGNADASYQTAPLTVYRDFLQKRAEALFSEVRIFGGRKARRYDGSYSILARSSGVTAAKIVIYQQGLGRENGVLPFGEDGVYALVRTSDKTGRAIWISGVVQALGFAQRLNPDSTVGIAPRHDRRFAYLAVADEADDRRIAELLATCSTS
jgi:hypothetical protein